MRILDLPEDIVKSILGSWLLIREWMLLQVSWCNRCSYSEFRLLMQSTPYGFDEYEYWTVDKLKWTLENEIKIKTLFLSRSFKFIHCSKSNNTTYIFGCICTCFGSDLCITLYNASLLKITLLTTSS